jgi:hypothetical protein
MRRTIILGALVLATLGGAASAAGAADKVPLAAKLATCTTGADPAQRAATFSASMPALDPAGRMLIRFRLWQRRGATGTFKAVDVPGWGGWERSEPGRPGFIFSKRIDSLVAPAGYRAVVTFRWLDRKGAVQRTRTRTTPICEQPDPRPDLLLASFAATPQGTGDAVYDVGVRNDGRSQAGAFTVVLTIDGRTAPPITFEPLAPGVTQNGQVVAPRCTPRSMVTIKVDPSNAVDEADETDSVVQQLCPLG